ncbi:16616_t:CDS:2, partial [Funneliformis caledonium]
MKLSLNMIRNANISFKYFNFRIKQAQILTKPDEYQDLLSKINHVSPSKDWNCLQ